MINTIQTALSGLAAASKKVEASASNVANLTTEGSLTDPAHPPYSATTTVQKAVAEEQGGGVRAQIVPKNTPFVPAYHPDSPFADAGGRVGVPNVDLAEEAVNLILAETAYKASLKVIETASQMSGSLTDILE